MGTPLLVLRTSLHVLRTLTLALWVGSIAFFAFGVAPVAFHVLPTTHEAGLVVSGSLHVLHAIGLTCGVVFLLAALASLATRPRLTGRDRAQSTAFPSPHVHSRVSLDAEHQADSDLVAEKRADADQAKDSRGGLHQNQAGFDPAPESRAPVGRAPVGRAPDSRAPVGQQRVRRRLAAVALVCLMSSLTVYSAFSIIPRMERDRVAAGGVIDAVPRSTPARVDFDRLHHTSEQVEGGVLLAGLLALILVTVDPERGAPVPLRG